MTTAVLIVAAGRGTRAGGEVPKQWQLLSGRPVLAHAARAFAGTGLLAVVLHRDDFDRARALPELDEALLVEGGPTRCASVRNGLEALDGRGIARVLIHDAARALVPACVITRVLAALDEGPGAAPGLPVTDALWRSEAGLVAGTQDRTGLFAAQTPQGFAFAAILAAHRAHGGDAADDVAVARAAGLPVRIVEGDPRNFKITLAGDLVRAQTMVNEAMDIRTGTGFDVHAFGPGNHVTLCGVEIAHERGLSGHSDADVGMHALTDAIYGALADGDIGRHFPPSDPQWKGADSAIFLGHAAGRARERGYRISNADVTLICERPKVGPHAAEMAARLAAILGIGADRVGIKATTSERLGFTGREEGIAAMATVTLVAP